MKIKCRCGRTLNIPSELAGKKVACKDCGQRYRLPPAKPRNPTVQVSAWKEGDDKEHAPADVGAVPLGEKMSLGWVLAAVVVTLVLGVGGAYGVHMGLKQLAAHMEPAEFARYRPYLALGTWWGPALACLIAGYLTARLSPGLTIAEPALGAALSVAILAVLWVTQPGPVGNWLQQIGLSSGAAQVQINAVVINLFILSMFIAACIACTGAYFGEVAQQRRSV
ncbi:MAG: hypothetical protein KatS3mg102_0801 [Planctomycetota bacterium]|nr:MAG: hypothetical protein KatS3mg102_0801 [Planctomycetota bacterium]